MDQALTALLTGELNTVSLLLLFIVGILTKRFVPWWVHEEVVKKLEEYEQAAPALLDEVSTLINLLVDDGPSNKVNEVVPDIQAKKEALRKIHKKQVIKGQRTRTRARKR